MTGERERRSERTSTASALGASVGVSLAQALTVVSVFLLFLAASTNEASRAQDPWAGLGFVFVGVFAAPAVAMVVGVVVARKLRLRLFGWYALAPVVAFATTLAFGADGLDGPLATAVLAGAAWNLSIAAFAGRRRTTDDD